MGDSESSQQTWSPAHIYDSSRYSPSVNDVMDVKGCLFEEFGLPIELIDTLIDYAEYWPHTTNVTSTSTIIRAQRDRENQFILRSYPLGFVPVETESQEFQMLPEYQQSYKTMDPKPWPETREFPDNATADVLKGWGKSSLPRGEYPCRKIVFTVKSGDQGWGGGAGRGTYNDSFTWFDTGLERVSAFREKILLEAWEVAPFPQFRLDAGKNESIQNPISPSHPTVCSLRTILPLTVPRDPNGITPLWAQNLPRERESESNYQFHHDLNPSPTALQKNVTASRGTKEHVITWSYHDSINPESVEAKALEAVGRGRETGTGEVVRNMKVGDVVTVWAKARYGQWINYVDEVKIDVYWQV